MKCLILFAVLVPALLVLGEEDFDDVIVVEAAPESERQGKQLIYQSWVPFQQNVPAHACYTSEGQVGKCMTYQKCNPFFRFRADLPTWMLGERDTCQTYSGNGQRSIYGVCCTTRQFGGAPFNPFAQPGGFPGAFPGVAAPPAQHPGVPAGVPGLGNGIPALPTHPPGHNKIPALPTYPPDHPGNPANFGKPVNNPPTNPTQRPTQAPVTVPVPVQTQAPVVVTPAPTQPPPPVPSNPDQDEVSVVEGDGSGGGLGPCGVGRHHPIRYNEDGEDVEARQRIDGEHPLRVVNGWPADKNEWPWIAALMRSGKQFCGGSLIDDRHILTAAHCVAHMSRNDVALLTIRLGEHDIKSNGETQIFESKVSRVVRHKGFSSQTLHNDVALITMSNPVPASYSSTIRPVCLPSGNERYDGQLATVVGWGSLRERGPQPAILQELTMVVWDNQRCSSTYGSVAPGGITEHMLCAGKKGKDSCSGDSGGPLQVGSGSTWTQIGVVSWGIGCGKEHYPGVYTRTTNMRPWIQKVQKKF